MADEVLALIDGGCRKMVFSLGPGALQCLYSVFLSKLVMFQRVMREHGGAMKLCDVTPEVREVFEACRLNELFDFAPDQSAALAAFATDSGGRVRLMASGRVYPGVNRRCNCHRHDRDTTHGRPARLPHLRRIRLPLRIGSRQNDPLRHCRRDESRRKT